MKILMITLACILIAVCGGLMPLMAHGRAVAATPLDIRQLRTSLPDASLVRLQGHITHRLDETLHEFTDGRDSLLIDLDDPAPRYGHAHAHRWQAWYCLPGCSGDPDTRVEVFGRYIHRALGMDHLRVIDLHVLPPAATEGETS